MSAPTAITAAWLRKHPLPDPFATEDKEGRGRVLVVGGSARVPGAVLLAANACLHAGAGKLHVATAAPVAQALAIALPEAMVSPMSARADGEIAALPAAILEAASQSDALVIGPGMSSGRASQSVATRLLRNAAGPCVLDAGAIAGATAGMHARGSGAAPCIITPHAGEMASLTGLAREAVEADPVRIARQVASECNCIVVMKGVPTHIVAPQGAVLRFQVRAPGLGVSGSGDVLAGLIGGLLARGATPLVAAAWGVWLHGQAGVALAQQFGPVGYLARDISAQVPRLMQRVRVGAKQAQ